MLIRSLHGPVRFCHSIGVLLLAAACSGDDPEQRAESTVIAESIYFNGDIVTVDDTNRVAKAVAVKNGRILAVGSSEQVLRYRGDDTSMIDLDGNALLPGFIDSHSHLSLTATKLGTVDLSPEPAGDIENIADIERALRARMDSDPPGENDWLIGWGYDHSMLAENRHPTRDDLDKISTEYDIVLIHFSGHQAVLNSSALERVGYDADTADPNGGVIQRRSDGREPNGIVEEAAWLPIWEQLIDMSFEQKLDLSRRAIELYASRGFTTAQDGALVDPDATRVYEELAFRDQLPIDVIGFPYAPFFDLFADNFDERREYNNGFRFGGIKLLLDGGSPGRTAYLREPYFVQLNGENGYRGYPRYSDQEMINDRVLKFYRMGVPVNVHALGDAAIDQAIVAIRNAEENAAAMDRRTNLIHLQFLQEDQIAALQDLDVTLTFQVAHNFYFGDLHREWTVGPERAAGLNPAASALANGIPFTIHHDSPVHPADQILLIWTTVQRETRSGFTLGPDQRISATQAIRASTIDAAYQYFEENEKGSIEPGKLADFVILSASPLSTNSKSLRNLQIVETIKNGRSIYRAPE